MRCEWWTRTGGAFSLGPVSWSQCTNDATVMLEVEQVDTGVKEVTKQPACMDCWKSTKDSAIKILSAEPIAEEGATG
jgi:hypothetical protein